MYYYVQNNAPHVWFQQSTSIQHLTVCVANSPLPLKWSHAWVRVCAQVQTFTLSFYRSQHLQGKWRFFQAQFYAFAMFINETAEFALCFSYRKHSKNWFTNCCSQLNSQCPLHNITFLGFPWNFFFLASMACVAWLDQMTWKLLQKLQSFSIEISNIFGQSC